MKLFQVRVLLINLAMILTFSGCGGGGGTSVSNLDENSETTTTASDSESKAATIQQPTIEPSPGTEPTSETEPATTVVPTPILQEPIISSIEPSTEPIAIEQPIVSPVEPAIEPLTVTEPTHSQDPICQTGSATQQGTIKDKNSNTGLANVTVTINGCSTTTDINGDYTLNNIEEKENAVINFKKEGYFPGSIKIAITELSGENAVSTNYVEYSMSAYTNAWENGRPWTFDSKQGASGGAVIVSAGSTYNDAIDETYNGIVSARWFFKDTMTSEGRDIFPGSFEGVNTNGVLVPFVAYGLMSIELKAEDDTPLNVSENMTLVLSSVTGTTENTLPLWYYDYDQGLWVEEGYAERQADGTYKAEVTRVGTWSLGKAITHDTGIYRGHIVDIDGSPMENVRVYAVGENWVSSVLSTSSDGAFELSVVPDSDFKLKAYNFEKKFGAEYTEVISGISSGNIVED